VSDETKNPASDQSPGITDDLLGTPEHPSARDLSQYLVHITSSEEALGSILASGHLEARKPHGFTSGLFMVHDQHLSACLTEMPLTELARMRRFGQYGVAFRKDFVRKAGGQRVWYLDDDSVPLTALTGIKDSLVERRAWDHEFWKVSPFIDLVKSRFYAWEHEREWRVVGGLKFHWTDIALVIAPDGSELGEGEAGTAVYDPTQDEITWWGGEPPEISAAVELLAAQFNEYWMTVDDAGIPYDGREGGYQNVGIEMYDGVDAVEYQFDDLPMYVRDGILKTISEPFGLYCRREEVDQYAKEAEEEHREYMRAHFPPWDPETPPELRF